MFNRQDKKSLYLVVTSIVAGLISVLFFIACLEFSGILALGWIIFAIVALVLSTTAILNVFRNWKGKKISSVIELIALTLSGFLLIGIFMGKISTFRLRNSIMQSEMYSIEHIGDLAYKYCEENKYMPDSNSWCDSFVNDKKYIYEDYFRIPQYHSIKYNFAFNKNLSRLPVKDLAGYLVFIFEADGDWNFSGGSELLDIKRPKDQYFLFRSLRFIYILFVDGTIAKYRLYDGAIAKYDKDIDAFTNFVLQGKTPYSPLRWK